MDESVEVVSSSEVTTTTKVKKSKKSKSREDSLSDELQQIDISTQRKIEMSAEMANKLADMPDVKAYVEKLQKIIRRQVQKIIKWKRKAKGEIGSGTKNIGTQTEFVADEAVENGSHFDDSPGGCVKEDKKSLTDDIKEAAEQAVKSSGLVYDATSGLYYDYSNGYYYNAEYGLYYDGTTGTYLKYNQETEKYEYHSQIELENQDRPEGKQRRGTGDSWHKKDAKRYRLDVNDMEEGEYTASSSDGEDDHVITISEEISKQWPPAMRLIVESTEIPKIKPGSLHIITCDGGSIGREDDHSIHLPDINVSKHHLKIAYDGEKYTITDLGSRNGTFLNGKRISSSKQESKPIEIPHGSKLQLGSTVLLCHIHEGTQTCGHCEPGLLIEEEKETALIGAPNLNQQYKTQLKKLKKKHGFHRSEESAKLGSGYTDRAQKRRETVGSQNPYEKTQTASLEQSISSQNKGFKLLAKMGWKEGQALGKDGTGHVEPIQLHSNAGTSGMGSTTTQTVSVNEARHKIWKKAQERFDKLPSNAVFDDELED